MDPLPTVSAWAEGIPQMPVGDPGAIRLHNWKIEGPEARRGFA